MSASSILPMPFAMTTMIASPPSSRPASILSVSSLNPAPTPPPLLPLPPLPNAPSPILADQLSNHALSLSQRRRGPSPGGDDRTRWRSAGSARSIRTLSVLVDAYMDGTITENSEGERTSLAQEEQVEGVSSVVPELALPPSPTRRNSKRYSSLADSIQRPITPSSSSDFLNDPPPRKSSLHPSSSSRPSSYIAPASPRPSPKSIPPPLKIISNAHEIPSSLSSAPFRKPSLPYSPLASPLLYNKDLPLTPVEREVAHEFTQLASDADTSLVDEILMEDIPLKRSSSSSRRSSHMLLSPPRTTRNSRIDEADVDMGERLLMDQATPAALAPEEAAAASGSTLTIKQSTSSPRRSPSARMLSASLPPSSAPATLSNTPGTSISRPIVPSPPSSPDIDYILSSTPRPRPTPSTSRSISPHPTPRPLRDRTTSNPVISSSERMSTASTNSQSSTSSISASGNIRTGTTTTVTTRNQTSRTSSRGDINKLMNRLTMASDPGNVPPSSFNTFSFSTGAGGKRISRARSDSGNQSLAPSRGSLSPRSTQVFDGTNSLSLAEEYDSAQESDDSLHLHTPLPELMVRAGLLSPSSRVLKTTVPKKTDSMLSFRTPLDTEKRKRRHRDGRMLRDGVGLTTGLGWSDSEDEDAPSPLRHRISNILISRKVSSSRASVLSMSTNGTATTTSTSNAGSRKASLLSRSTSSSTLSSDLLATPNSPPMTLAALGSLGAGIGMGIGIGLGPPPSAKLPPATPAKVPRSHRPSEPIPPPSAASTGTKMSAVRRIASHASVVSSAAASAVASTLTTPTTKTSTSWYKPAPLSSSASESLLLAQDTSRSQTPRARSRSNSNSSTSRIGMPTTRKESSPELPPVSLSTSTRTRTISTNSNASSVYSSRSTQSGSLTADGGFTSSDTSDASHATTTVPPIKGSSSDSIRLKSNLKSRSSSPTGSNKSTSSTPPSLMTAMSLTFPAPPPLTPSARAAAAKKGRIVTGDGKTVAISGAVSSSHR